jgi:hypothetical protein
MTSFDESTSLTRGKLSLFAESTTCLPRDEGVEPKKNVVDWRDDVVS